MSTHTLDDDAIWRERIGVVVVIAGIVTALAIGYSYFVAPLAHRIVEALIHG